MCSVVGYVGEEPCQRVVVDGLRRLEYRGYDSAGFACIDVNSNRLLYAKTAGNLSNLIEKLTLHPIDGRVGIGHTRWATHGVASSENAHPQLDCEKKIAVVHNGIIENFDKLKKILEKDSHSFFSETDTEVIAHLLEHALELKQNPQEALLDVVKKLDGAYAFVALVQDYPGMLFIARRGSPLCIGVGDREHFVASDVLAFAGRTDRVLFMPERSIGIVQKDAFELYNFEGNKLSQNIQVVDAQWMVAEKDGHEHFMLKEIYEQKNAIFRTIQWFQSIREHVWKYVGLSAGSIKKFDRVIFLGCGTSWHAGLIGEFFFEEIANMSANSALSSEFRYRKIYANERTLFIAISQSGETADTLEALRFVENQKLLTVALTNVPSSTIVREADGFLLTHAGPEVAVASTKAFSTQIAALYWLAHRIAVEKGLLTMSDLEQKENDVLTAAQILENVIEEYKYEIIHEHAKFYARFEKFVFLGRHIGYPFALEAALKLKEISYIFCQAYPAGELKHGPLALIDEKTPVFLFSHPDPIIYKKILANAQEVKARKGHIVAFTFEGQDELKELADLAFVVPVVEPLLTPLIFVGLVQFFAYQIAKKRGCHIDKPRNLAKSVTVE